MHFNIKHFVNQKHEFYWLSLKALSTACHKIRLNAQQFYFKLSEMWRLFAMEHGI